MVGYVKHFFGCQDCVKHFLEEAEVRIFVVITKEIKSRPAVMDVLKLYEH